jgi:hypothetical protein
MARTGLFTPPGINARARSKSCSERDVFNVVVLPDMGSASPTT